MEERTYIESEDKLVVRTIYDPEPVFEQNAIDRASGPVTFGSKGQQLTLAARIPMEHLIALKNLGYDVLSPDPDERRRALSYIQSEQSKLMTTDKNVFALRRTKWA